MSDLNLAHQAIMYIDSSDRVTWYKAAMALKSEFGESAFDIFINWSKQTASFNMRDAKAVWNSVNRNGGITIGTLFYLAKQNGWKADKNYCPPSDAEIAKRKLEQAIASQIQQQQKFNEQKKRSITSQKIWNGARAASFNHGYLQMKQVKPHNLRQVFDTLLIPLYFQQTLVNLQRINADGQKRFEKGGMVKGCYSPIGKIDSSFYICEGWSTGATIHELTHKGVLCAMNAGNLLEVAKQARVAFPCAEIIIAGDDDRFNKRNMGRIMANEAAMAINAKVIFPCFPDGCNGTDFNDIYMFEKQGGLSK